MAELNELFDLAGNTPLLNQVHAAVIVVATEVLDEPATADPALDTARARWASRALRDPATEAIRSLRIILGSQHNASVLTITGLGKVAILNRVRSGVTKLATAEG